MRTLRTAAATGIERTSEALGVVAAAALGILMLHVVVDVIGRALWGRPLPATLEIAQYWWMPLLVFLAMAGTQRRDENIRVTLLIEGLPPRARRVADVVGLALLALVTALLLAAQTSDALHAAAIGEASLGSSVPVPIWPVKLLVLLGLAALLAQTVLGIVRALARTDDIVRADDIEHLLADGDPS
ncbi:TRAP transporter small permease subunit [Microbacterium sp. No. 7]|uniref:TRAP transporter small permease subunit n=1 Tax=Microbacterium sp. No. 7 TaxID=1714373 RepID=UPI0006D0AB1A|nr:TRAP transporter small permease [Microbacterium sp. No. 7]